MSRADKRFLRGLRVENARGFKKWLKTPEGRAAIEAQQAKKGDTFTAELVTPEPKPRKARR